MPSHGPRRRQRLTRADGLVIEFPETWENVTMPPANDTYGVKYSSSALVNNFCNVAAIPSTTRTLINRGTENLYIRDYLNSRDDDGDLPMGDVDHEKFHYLGNSLIPWTGTACSGRGVICTPIGAHKPIMDITGYDRMFERPPNSVLQKLCDEAFERFNTQFPEEISIANFLYELRDIVSLIPQLSKSIVKMAANLHLGIEFGWKPLIGDIQAMLNVLDRVDARIAYLINTYDKYTRLGYSRNNIHQNSWGMNYAYTRSVGDGLEYRYTLKTYSVNFRAGGRLFHKIDYLRETAGKVRALMGAFGFTNPAKIIWNAVPYSFIVDWVADISGLLSRYANMQDASSQWKIDRMHWSITTKATVDVAQVNRTGAVPKWIQHLGTFHFQGYVRRAGLSVTQDILNLVSPSFRQQVLLAALLAGKSR